MKINLLIIFIVIVSSCQKKEIGPQYEDASAFGAGKKVLVLNEGNFGWGNATVSVYKPNENVIYNNQFQRENNFSPGDVLQSGIRLNDKYYLTVNNSGVVYECDSASLRVVRSFSGLTSPRTILPISNNRMLISDLYSNKISVLNLSSGNIETNIANVGWVEAMMLSDGNIYAGQANGKQLYIIDEVSLAITDSVEVAHGVNSISKDVNGKIWMLSDGGFGIETPSLTVIEPSDHSIIKTITFPSNSMSPGHLNMNKQGDEVHYLNGGVFKMNITDVVLPNLPAISGAGKVFYGMNIDPTNNEIYTTDAKDYVQPGMLFRYSSSGVIIDSVQTSVIPQGIIF